MARKSRAQPVPEKPDADRALLWRIGIYIRISREDARSGGESESVTNQRKTNLAFIEENFQKGTFLLAGDYDSADIVPLMKEMLSFIAGWEGEIP